MGGGVRGGGEEGRATGVQWPACVCIFCAGLQHACLRTLCLRTGGTCAKSLAHGSSSAEFVQLAAPGAGAAGASAACSFCCLFFSRIANPLSSHIPGTLRLRWAADIAVAAGTDGARGEARTRGEKVQAGPGCKFIMYAHMSKFKKTWTV